MFSKPKTPQKMTLLLVFFLCWLCWSPSLAAIDITHILGQHPELSTFSNYLTQTQLAQDINSRQTITVLAVANSDMGRLSGKPMDEIKKILAVHVLLDYYDMTKFKTIEGNTLTVTTLLQATGQALAVNNQGFVNITVSTSGAVTFGSAATGIPAQPLAQLVKAVESDPYSISVLQVSAPIITVSAPSPTPTQHASPPPAHSPASHSPESHPPASHPPASHSPVESSPAHSPLPIHGSPSPSSEATHAPTQNAPEPSEASDASPEPSNDYVAHAPQPSSPTPLSVAPQPSEDEAPTPTPTQDDSTDDANSPSPTGDSPSLAPKGNSPGEAPGSGDSGVPTSADDEGKGKKASAGGIVVPSSSAGWMGAVVLCVILGKLV